MRLLFRWAVACLTLSSWARAMIDDHPGAASRATRLPFSQSSYIVKKKGRKPQLVRAEPGVNVEEAVAAERKRPGVEYAELNGKLYAADFVPNDPLLALDQLWHLNQIHAPEAWSTSTGDATKAVKVCIVDTGVDYTHPDIAANYIFKSDGSSMGLNVVNPYVDHIDDHMHGSHIAGVIGAVGNNAIGAVGINWRVGIIACKFMDEKGVGTDFGAAECVNWCAAQGARVISASFGGSTYSTALRDAIRESNALFVAAAGNGGPDQIGDPEPEYPAAYGLDNIIVVAATGPDDTLCPWSNYSPTKVHVAAPGMDITSTVPYSRFPAGYLAASGTSMATPMVSGAAALALAAFGGSDSISPSRLRELLIDSADYVPDLDGKVVSKGRLSLSKMMDILATMQPESQDPGTDSEPFLWAGLHWVPAVDGDCTASCKASLKKPLQASKGANSFVCALQKLQGDDYTAWPGGTQAATTDCEGVYIQESYPFPYVRADGDFHCACIDRKAKWREDKCPSNAKNEQPICRYTEGSQVWVGGTASIRNGASMAKVCLFNVEGVAYYSSSFEFLCTYYKAERSLKMRSLEGLKNIQDVKNIQELGKPANRKLLAS